MVIKVTTRIQSPRPTSTDVPNGVDYDVELWVIDEVGATNRWDGEVTYAPNHEGNLVPYGDGLDHWLSGSLISAIDKSWLSAHPRLVKAIVNSLANGEGVDEFEVTL